MEAVPVDVKEMVLSLDDGTGDLMTYQVSVGTCDGIDAMKAEEYKVAITARMLYRDMMYKMGRWPKPIRP